MRSREFNKQIFMGNCCHGGCTEYSMYQLIESLMDAFKILSGKQQNGGMGYEFNKDTDKQDQEDLELIVEDIAMALTGKRIRFAEDTDNDSFEDDDDEDDEEEE